jgi:hypothetical protein
MTSLRLKAWIVASGTGALGGLALPANVGAQTVPSAPGDDQTSSRGKFAIEVDTKFVPIVSSLISNGPLPGYTRQPATRSDRNRFLTSPLPYDPATPLAGYGRYRRRPRAA